MCLISKVISRPWINACFHPLLRKLVVGLIKKMPLNHYRKRGQPQMMQSHVENVISKLFMCFIYCRTMNPAQLFMSQFSVHLNISTMLTV